MSYVNRKLEDLKFWKDNPRIESNHSTQEGILNAIAELNPKKLLALCQTIVKYKKLLEPPLIDNCNIVYDGNRRLTALTVLHNPALAPMSVQKKIKALLNATNKKLIDDIARKIVCRQEKDHTLIQLLVNERHATEEEGLKQIPWGPLEKARWSDPHSLIVQVIQYGDKQGLTLPIEGYSTLERFVTTGGVSSILKRELKKDNPKLKEVIGNLYAEIKGQKLDTRKSGTAANRKEKMFTMFKEAGIECEKYSGTVKKGTDKAKSKSGTKGKSSPAGAKQSTDKNYLIDENSSLPDVSKMPKINDIINELRRLKVKDFPNAVGILFRTLIELSTDSFLEREKLAEKHKKSELQNKLNSAIVRIQSRGNYPGSGKNLEVLRNDIANQKADVSITKFNAFVHTNLLPDPKSLCRQYTNMETLIAFMLSEAQR